MHVKNAGKMQVAITNFTVNYWQKDLQSLVLLKNKLGMMLHGVKHVNAKQCISLLINAFVVITI